MLRIYGNRLTQQVSRMVISIRPTATDPASGSINAAHDKFAEREQALENAYFRKQNEELLAKLRKRYEELEKNSNDIEAEQTRIEQEIKKLEKQREELMKKSSKSTKS